MRALIIGILKGMVVGCVKMLNNVMLKTIFISYCLSQIHLEFVKTEPSRSDSTIYRAGVFPLCYRNERGEVFSSYGCSLVLS